MLNFFRLVHPYFDEIESFEPNELLLQPVEPKVKRKNEEKCLLKKIFSFVVKVPKSLEETKCLFVDTIDKLQTMMDHLELQSELAIDLEVKSNIRFV